MWFPIPHFELIQWFHLDDVKLFMIKSEKNEPTAEQHIVETSTAGAFEIHRADGTCPLTAANNFHFRQKQRNRGLLAFEKSVLTMKENMRKHERGRKGI